MREVEAHLRRGAVKGFETHYVPIEPKMQIGKTGSSGNRERHVFFDMNKPGAAQTRDVKFVVMQSDKEVPPVVMQSTVTGDYVVLGKCTAVSVQAPEGVNVDILGTTNVARGGLGGGKNVLEARASGTHYYLPLEAVTTSELPDDGDGIYFPEVKLGTSGNIFDRNVANLN